MTHVVCTQGIRCSCPDVRECGNASPLNDDPQYSVIAREVGSRSTVIHSRHETRIAADEAKDELAWSLNRDRVICTLGCGGALMDCYCGMFESHCPYEIGGECHNEIDATECSEIRVDAGNSRTKYERG